MQYFYSSNEYFYIYNSHLNIIILEANASFEIWTTMQI